ncbi:hypothetical protein AMTRI_Chr12g274510 [Amborella trichopoda]
MATSFDRWQKDVFFSAAEEVQESADLMESVYRTWLKDRREGSRSDDSDELRRDLHTALGTAKWQVLEEFERAVKSCQQNSMLDDSASRHKQFVLVIENQIARIEKALMESAIEEGKEGFRWVQLDKEERDDLALFLSGTPQGKADKSNPLPLDKEVSHEKKPVPCGEPCRIKEFKEIVTINNDAKFVVEFEAKELHGTRDGNFSHGESINGHRRTTSEGSDIGAWKIVIADGDEKTRSETLAETSSQTHGFCGLLKGIESRTKIKWSKSGFGKGKDGDPYEADIVSSSSQVWRGPQQLTQGINRICERSRNCFDYSRNDFNDYRAKQLLGWCGGIQKRLQRSHYSVQQSSSRHIFKLLLTIICIAVFIFYAI